MEKPAAHVTHAVIWSVVLSYVLRLSAGDRGGVDWIVIALVVGAILRELWLLRRRLDDHGGAKAVWHELRTVLFWLLGLMNTVWARPEDRGAWKWWVGLVLLAVAAADTVALWVKERRIIREAGPTGEEARDE